MSHSLAQPSPWFDEPEPPHLRWPWLLFALALAAWWPIAPYWQSDDLVAVHYAHDLRRALSDFAGNQYGLAGLVWFYRPLITLSFALEGLVAGVDPLLSHVTNSTAHALCAMLAGMCAARYLGSGRGFLCGLAWGLAPGHVGAVFWAVGRVDSHTAVWILLACRLAQRWCDGAPRALPLALVAFVLALCSKESAIAVPALVVLVCLATGPQRRVRRAVRGASAFFVVLGAYLAWRTWLFGTPIGGYESAQMRLGASLDGLGRTIAHLCNPLLYAGHRTFALPEHVRLAGVTPVLLALAVLVVRRRWALLAGLGALFAAGAAPVAQFWADGPDPKTLRYFSLAALAIAGLVAAAGFVPSILLLAVQALPMLDLRASFERQFADNRGMHARLREASAELESDLAFVAGLPAQSADGAALAFHLGVDRLLVPPFTDRATRVLALRPAAMDPATFRLPYGDSDGLPFDLPVLAFEGAGILAHLPPARVPDVRVTARGPEVLTARELARVNAGEARASLALDGVRARRFRVTLFTATGYLSAYLAHDAPTDTIDVVELLKARYAGPSAGPAAHVAFALEVPTALDLDLRFPVLVEAGEDLALPDGTTGFRTTHANRRPVWLEFARDYSAFIHGRTR